MNLEELEAKIIDACEKAKAKGFDVLPNQTIDHTNKRCCVIGAVMLDIGTTEIGFRPAAEHLGIETREADMIANGYDNYGWIHNKENEFWQLGNKLNKRYHYGQ